MRNKWEKAETKHSSEKASDTWDQHEVHVGQKSPVIDETGGKN